MVSVRHEVYAYIPQQGNEGPSQPRIIKFIVFLTWNSKGKSEWCQVELNNSYDLRKMSLWEDLIIVFIPGTAKKTDDILIKVSKEIMIS